MTFSSEVRFRSFGLLLLGGVATLAFVYISVRRRSRKKPRSVDNGNKNVESEKFQSGEGHSVPGEQTCDYNDNAGLSVEFTGPPVPSGNACSPGGGSISHDATEEKEETATEPPNILVIPGNKSEEVQDSTLPSACFDEIFFKESELIPPFQLDNDEVISPQAVQEDGNFKVEKIETPCGDSSSKHGDVIIKPKSHSHKSKIPHYSYREKAKVLALQQPSLSPAALTFDQKHLQKQLRFGNFSRLKRAEDEEDLKRRYKSLFRSKQMQSENTICSDSKHFSHVQTGKHSSEEASNSNRESLITDEDGSNLLVESGFFDNDLSPSFESHEIPEGNLKSVSAKVMEESLPIFERPEVSRSQQSDADLFKEAEEELIINLAIQDADVKLLLDAMSRTESVRLVARGFQSLADLSKDGSTHDLYSCHLSFILSCLDLEGDTLRVDVLKVLLNLSRSPQLVPHLLFADVPVSLLKYFLLDIDEEIQLTWLAFVVNIFDYWKRNKSILQVSDIQRKENCIYGLLLGIRSNRTLRSRVYLLTRHRNRHISHVAREIYADMSKREGV